MKKTMFGLMTVFIMIFLVACGSKNSVKADYTESEFETALNDGKDVDGKTVKIKVLEYVPDGTLGFTIQAGEHLNFISSENPKVKNGDELVVKVKKVENLMGSYIISYEKM